MAQVIDGIEWARKRRPLLLRLGHERELERRGSGQPLRRRAATLARWIARADGVADGRPVRG